MTGDSTHRHAERVRAKVVAIHQPNFFPWLGFFDKIAHCDIFVLLDNVQFPKTGGVWSNRARILAAGSPTWITMPIVRSFSGTRTIAEIRISDATDWRMKVTRTIGQRYARAPHRDAVLPFVSSLVGRREERLVEFNLHAIHAIAGALGLRTQEMILGSDLHVSGSATDLLIAIVRAAGGDVYLSGGGAGGYQEDEKFAEAGIELRYQKFRHPEYPQTGADQFVSGLSIIDALMNCGVAGTSALLGGASSTATSSLLGQDGSVP